MATNRLPVRRAGRVKINDENANAQGPVLTKTKLNALPAPGGAQRVPIVTKTITTAAGTQRAALGEVTINHRKDTNIPSKPTQIGVVKRPRSSSLAAVVPQRAQSNPASRPTSKVPRVPVPTSRPTSLRSDILVKEDNGDEDIDMKAEEDAWNVHQGMDILSEDEEVQKTEVETMVGVETTYLGLNRATSPAPASPPPISSPVSHSRASTSEPVSAVKQAWPKPASARTRAEIEKVREDFVDEVDDFDPTMVSEYADEIFAYMGELEEQTMPGANYVDGQGEITWEMRQTLVDWLLQVHLRYRLLPETLWIAVNIVDRFLTKRVVSLVKLQLVGVTAMFIAAKYEEIMAPSVDEFVFMTENGYQRDEILKGERIILQTLDFRVSSYCTPYSWIRRISKADDYDLQTRTLSKFLMEVTLLDYRFLRAKPSMIAAVGMYSARKMLGGDWDEAFVYYSGFTESQVKPGHDLLVDKLCSPEFENQYVYKKYLHKRFLKASSFAREWALRTISGDSEGSLTP